MGTEQMVELIDSVFSIFVQSICLSVVLVRALKTKRREWQLLFMFYAVYFFSSVYWLLYVIFYDESPVYTHIAEFGFYVSYLVMIMILQDVRDKEMDGVRYKRLFFIPVFTWGMAGYYIWFSEGDYISNIICAILMTSQIWGAVKGILYNKKKNKNYTEKLLYRSVLIICTMEYLGWTASCIWFDVSWTNPYYWFDMMFSLSLILLIPGIRRVVEK